MEQEIKIDFPVFNYSIYVVYTSDIARSRKARSVFIGAPDEELGSYVDGLHSFSPIDPDSFVFFTPSTSIGVITHEAFHALWRMFKWVGAKLENETFAYHLSYLVDKILEQKKQWDGK